MSQLPSPALSSLGQHGKGDLSKGKAKASTKGSSKSNSKPKAFCEAVTLEQFISQMLPLVDLEKEAEIAASLDALSNLKPEIAQKRGSIILNLKCTDVQSGLLGKTLLELQANRGDLLPPHKLTPHDVVNLKLNKGDGNSPSLGQGTVYRIKDNSIVLAVDDPPEEGLDSPLRLEKLANEVTYRRLKDTLIELSKGVKGPAVDLVPVLFGGKAPSFAKKPVTFTPFNKNLDHSQTLVSKWQ